MIKFVMPFCSRQEMRPNPVCVNAQMLNTSNTVHKRIILEKAMVMDNNS